jgi:hypothetical protein
MNSNGKDIHGNPELHGALYIQNVTRQWYDESAIEIRNNELILKTQYNPKYFPELDTTSNIGVGLIHCPDRLRHGIYEIEAMYYQQVSAYGQLFG